MDLRLFGPFDRHQSIVEGSCRVMPTVPEIIASLTEDAGALIKGHLDPWQAVVRDTLLDEIGCGDAGLPQ
jgi:hypothetical protein